LERCTVAAFAEAHKPIKRLKVKTDLIAPHLLLRIRMSTSA
jgi:hypothetical protein